MRSNQQQKLGSTNTGSMMDPLRNMVFHDLSVGLLHVSTFEFASFWEPHVSLACCVCPNMSHLICFYYAVDLSDHARLLLRGAWVLQEALLKLRWEQATLIWLGMQKGRHTSRIRLQEESQENTRNRFAWSWESSKFPASPKKISNPVATPRSC